MKKLSKTLGKSEEDIISLAKETNTNLFAVEQGFADTMASIVKGLARTQQDINAIFADQMGEAADKFRIFGEEQRAPAVLDEIGRAIYEANQAGTLDEATASDKLSEMLTGFTQFYGGNQQQALLSMLEQIGPGGKAFDQENGYFSDPAIRELFTTGPLGALLSSMQADALKTTGTTSMDQLTSALASLDSGAMEGFGPVFDALPEVFASLAQTDYAKFDALQKFLDPSQQSDLRKGKNLNQLSASEIMDVLGSQLGDLLPKLPGFRELENRVPKVEEELANLGYKASDAATALTAVTDILNGIAGVTPKTDTTGADTRTPRGDTASSRFNATFMKHQALSSMVTGKRQITSGVRNFNLGSINSDHVTGGALDLVGQNLGQYKSAVEANGGFAEFHGVNAARHLHVVPNARATGDSSTAVSVGSVGQDGSTMGGSTNNYSININGYNKSPQQLAAEVLALIKSNERSITERR